jgi:predicted  nucleic acid-binding Zn-ribbon protein
MGKKAKGKRPIYLDHLQTDQLLAIVMALAGEVSVLRERLDTLERLMQAKGVVSVAEIEAYQPDEQVTQEREQWRTDYLARLLRVIEAEVEANNSPK